MRSLLAAALLFAAVASAQEAPPKPLSIAVEAVGDRDAGVVARVFFRFANPRAITEAGLFLEGSLSEGGRVPRNFRFPVPRKNDKFIWNNTLEHNGKLIRSTRWAVLPDKRNEMSMLHLFGEGEVEIEARLILEGDNGAAPQLVAEAHETFTLAKTNNPLPADAVGDDEARAATGAVTIAAPRSRLASGIFLISVDVLPPVNRVEFRVEDKKVRTRNAPPYTTELDLGDAQKRVTVRAIGYDAADHFVDADAFVINESEPLAVKITRIATTDGLTHFKLSVRNASGGAPEERRAVRRRAEAARMERAAVRGHDRHRRAGGRRCPRVGHRRERRRSDGSAIIRAHEQHRRSRAHVGAVPRRDDRRAGEHPGGAVGLPARRGLAQRARARAAHRRLRRRSTPRSRARAISASS